jgi:type II secretory pathway component PulC
MLRNKKYIRILLPLVLIIWGLLFYQIISFFSNKKISIPQPNNYVFKNPTFKKKKRFVLTPIKSDPFLGKLYGTNTKLKHKRISQNKSNIIWPTIKYQGIITVKNNNSQVFIVSINGKQYLVKKGDTIENIKVLKSDKSNVVLEYKGQKKAFSIK